jgi:xanthine dehydrogenase YagR molybdenum-binding subunit
MMRNLGGSCCAWPGECRNSPLADAAAEEVALSDGRLASRRDERRAVSITDVLRHGSVDRIEQEKATNPDQDATRANNGYAAVWGIGMAPH